MAPPSSIPKVAPQGSPKGRGKGKATAKAKAKPKADSTPQGRSQQGASQGMESAKKSDARMKKLETMFETFMKRAPGEKWTTVQAKTKECWTCTQCEFAGTWVSKKVCHQCQAKRNAQPPQATPQGQPATQPQPPTQGQPQATPMDVEPPPQAAPDLEVQLRDYEAMLSGLSKAQAGDSLNKEWISDLEGRIRRIGLFRVWR